WRKSEEKRLARVVDPVDVCGVFERRRDAALPPVEQDENALIPEREVTEEAGHRPARGQGLGEIGVAGAGDERPKALALRVVFLDVAAIRAHAFFGVCLPVICGVVLSSAAF